MTHQLHFPPYLPRGKIDGELHPVDAAERPVPGQTVPGIEYQVLAVVQRILRQTLEITVLPSRTLDGSMAAKHLRRHPTWRRAVPVWRNRTRRHRIDPAIP